MIFKEKLIRCTDGKNKSLLSRAAGLAATGISNYIASGSVPRADIALRLARALGVPLDWLIDDMQGWPPPSNERSIRDLIRSATTTELRHELALRYRNDLKDAATNLREAESEDWKAVSTETSKLKPDEQPSAWISARIFKLQRVVSTLVELATKYEPFITGDGSMWSKPDGAGERQPDLAEICNRYKHLIEQPGVSEVLESFQHPMVRRLLSHPWSMMESLVLRESGKPTLKELVDSQTSKPRRVKRPRT